MKVYVAVELTCDEAGVMHPQRILWEDGRKFEITSISDVRAASLKAGGSGIRYTCRIGKKDAYLIMMTPKWFVDP
ncbi:MAG: hypothetical protein R2881_09660 [Eubacteriales bacterium]